jgi:RNA polymerase sigma factor (sigma-70 family)
MATAQLGNLLRHIHTLAAPGGAGPRSDRELLDDFAGRRDEAAFAALVARHGPMVLRVCRRVLGHEQDAEDAFQATFLVLARHTGSIRKREALAGWLHGVAYRTAMKARRSAARRRQREAHLRDRTPGAATGLTWDEVQAALDEEIGSLPGPYRAAFVLCVLEGKSGHRAAAELGVKEGTVWSRLARARQILRRRLTRRGIRLAGVLAALSVGQGGTQAGVPAGLARLTVRFGLLAAAGPAAAGSVPPHVAALAAGVTRAMSTSKLPFITAAFLAAGLLAAGAGLLARQTPAASQAPAESQKSEGRSPKPEPVAARPVAEDRDSLAYGGRVLGPDGRPVGGARLYLMSAHGYPWRPSPSPALATTGPDGRFAFTVPKAKYGDLDTVVTAAAADFGAGWVKVPTRGKRDDLALQLVEDDVPITGQVVDLEAKPIPGATLTVLEISAAAGDDLGPWLEAVRARKVRSFDLEQRYLKRSTTAPSPKATTDAGGRFRLTGIGRDRLVRVLLEGPGIASTYLHILTRPGKTLEATEFEGRPEYNDPRRVTTYYPANFRHVANPARPIVGVVRDRDTKKPLAGVSVQTYKLANHPLHYMDGQEIERATTDAQGRYRLAGMPKGAGNKLRLVPPGDLPYLAVVTEVHDSPGLDPVTVDFELKRGVWVEGRMTDKVTGKPLRGLAEYFPLFDNPNVSAYPDYSWLQPVRPAKEDGSYRVVALPGPGVVAVYYQTDFYLRAPDRDDEFGAKQVPGKSLPFPFDSAYNYGALARIDPARGAEKVVRDVTLDPGWRFTGTVLGPDGKPLAAARGFGVTRHWWDREPMQTADFTAWFNPRHPPREFLFHHPEKGLVGVAQTPKENGGSVTVRMGPGAAVTGRLVDARGKPQPGVELEVKFQPKDWGSWTAYLPDSIRTDREGRFRIEGLPPGCKLRLDGPAGQLPLGDGLHMGRAKDLGDVRLKPEGPRGE